MFLLLFCLFTSDSKILPIGREEVRDYKQACIKICPSLNKEHQAELDALWKENESVLDKVTKSLALGNPKLFEYEARIYDENLPLFIKANLVLFYARQYSKEDDHEKVIELLTLCRPDDTCDPNLYFYLKGLANYSLMNKEKAQISFGNLNLLEMPERYKSLVYLMEDNMTEWNEDDIGFVARKMKMIEQRLANRKGGKLTQKYQREVIAKLDELIKELENQKNQNQLASQAGSKKDNANKPLEDSHLPQEEGSNGEIDKVVMKKLAENWGKLPEKERATAIIELTRDMPGRYKEVIENYIRESQRRATK